MPLHSMISGKVADIFGIEYRLAAVGVSLAAGLALAVVLYRLFVGSLNWRARDVFDTRALVGDESRNRIALWALAVYAFSPASPIFVTGYAEALSTLLLALSVWCVARERLHPAPTRSSSGGAVPPAGCAARCICRPVVAVVHRL